MEYTDWVGCYKESWGKRLSPLSYSHPAKGAYGLAKRIYEYGITQGWFGPGDTILDPFAGVGGFAFHAMQHGMHFVGVELELNFVDLGQGCDCTGIGREDWIRYQGRWKRMRYEGRHWCPQCIDEVGRLVGGEKRPTLSRARLARRTRISELAAIVGRKPKLYDDMPLPPWGSSRRRVQLGMFEVKPSATYTRDSGEIPHTEPHHYKGNVEIWTDQGGMPGSAIIVQGDSRRLIDVIKREASGSVVSSPPFGAAETRDATPYSGGRVAAMMPYAYTQAHQGDTEGNLGNLPATEEGLDVAISSPPFLAQSGGTNVTSKTGPLADESLLKRHSAGNVAAKGYGDARGQLGVMPEGKFDAVFTSSPYTASLASDDPDRRGGLFRDPKRRSDKTLTAEYGDSEGQLGTMKEGDVDAVIASPPYEGSMDSKKSGIDWTKMKKADGSIRDMTDEPYQAFRPGAGAEMRYGQTEGQLGAMKSRGFDASVASPPFEDQNACNDPEYRRDRVTQGGPLYGDYGESEGQLGQEQAETFWSAARQIVDQTYRVLAPGAYAIFVCKRFVRDKKIVKFSQQWCSLCESCGFELVEWIRAWLIEDRGAQYTLTGELEERKVERFSFFRRLHTKKYPHLAIEWEDVIVLRKPLSQ